MHAPPDVRTSGLGVTCQENGPTVSVWIPRALEGKNPCLGVGAVQLEVDSRGFQCRLSFSGIAITAPPTHRGVLEPVCTRVLTHSHTRHRFPPCKGTSPCPSHPSNVSLSVAELCLVLGP